MNQITSNQNPHIKEIKSLKDKKYRESKRLFFIEGIRFVEEALKEKVDIVKILVSDMLPEIKGGNEILSKVLKDKYVVFSLPDRLFRDISDTDNPQGILAVIKMRSYSIDEIVKDDNFIIILDSVQDPGNLGTIVRTADAAGVTGLVISRGCVDLYNPKVLRATMGSVFHIPIYFSNDILDTIKVLQSKKIKVITSHLEGNSNYFKLNMKNDVALVIGNEANGVSGEVEKISDVLVKIPMPGKSESLNASIAASLLMYEVVRQRMCSTNS